MDQEAPKKIDPKDLERLNEMYEDGRGGLDESGVTKEQYRRAFTEVGKIFEEGRAHFYNSSGSFQKALIDGMNVEQAPDISDEDLEKLLDETGNLRRKLNTAPGFEPGKTPEEMLEILRNANLTETLAKWAENYVRDIGFMLKKDQPPMLTDTTDLLLRTAELLR
jgi:hypothetical protein